MPKQLTSLAVLLLLLVLPTSLLAAPAHAGAGETGFWVKRDAAVVLHDGCYFHQFSWSVPAEVDEKHDWTLAVTLRDRRGEVVQYVNRGPQHGRTGTTSGGEGFLFCSGKQTPGTHTLEAELAWATCTLTCLVTTDHRDHATDTFVVRKPVTRTGLRVNDTTAAHGQRLVFTARSRQECPSGFCAGAGRRVSLQRKTSSGWVTIATRTTGERGVVRFTPVWKHRRTVPVRAVTRHSPEVRGSRSSTLWIR